MNKRNKYIEGIERPNNRSKLENDILYLSKLKHSLYDLIVPSNLIKLYPDIKDYKNNFIEPDNYKQEINGFIIWHIDRQVELPSFTNIRIPIDFQIILYSQLLAKLTQIRYNLDTGN